ncbi:hypothetical protein LXA43DRAFT_1102518 [Ganoderma leucocontextum]|nr:hypothetical protein LXA43DRAFT_1102518 [Ganoderma leucocontextum]
MTTPDTQDQTLWGPINVKRKKADLDVIAQALDIFRPKSKDNRSVLARKINDHLKQNPGLAKEKHFQGLFSYRRDKEAERGAPKSSAEKEAEVELEASKSAKQATGALKTLVDQDIARDPPARTARLNGRFTRSSAPAKATAEDSSGEEESSLEPGSELPSTLRTPITSTEPESMNLDEFEVSNATSSADSGAAFPETPKKALDHAGESYSGEEQGLNPNIVVTFQHDSGPVDEVHVPGAGRLVHRVRDKHGKAHTSIHLSELLPIAFEYASTPMKNRGGCLSRPGTIGDSHVDIGPVAAFTRKERVKYLESEGANSYKLEPACDDGNTLVCRLFVRGESGLTVQSSQPHSTVAMAPASTVAATTVNLKPGSSSKVKASQPEDQAGKNVEDPFIVWLRDKLDGPKREWKKGLSVAVILLRVKALRSTVEHLSDWGWEKSQGGYQVPEGRQFNDGAAGIYAGRSFKKDDVLRVLRLGSTTANSNDKLFAPAAMRKIPQLLEWFNEPDGRHAAFFQDMSIKDFSEWRDNELEPAEGRTGKGKEKAKKRKYAEDGESKKRKKKEKRLSSEDLD